MTPACDECVPCCGCGGNHDGTREYDADEIMECIAAALKEGDLTAAAALTRWLAVVDPHSAEVIIMLATLKGEL
jgi:hypothetical protein